ncbi:MAG: hypothetical protein IPO08_21695 [Xanthomonadales bacterium]|nr:hypothetical protein [Xanthomonadales bacterium]
MPYAQIDVDALDHWKVGGLSAEAFRTWVAGLCYCQKHLTDGLLVHRAVKMLRAKTTAPVIAELLDAGLWHEGPAGYVVHDFTTWNRTRAEVESQREKWRKKKAGVSRGSKGDSPGEAPETPRTDTIRDATRRSEDETHTPPAAPVSRADAPGVGRVVVAAPPPSDTEHLLEHWRAVGEQHGVLEPIATSPKVAHQARELLALHGLDALRQAVEEFWASQEFLAKRHFGMFHRYAGQLVAHVLAGHTHTFGERPRASAKAVPMGFGLNNADGCQHDPPCATYLDHQRRWLDEERARQGLPPRPFAADRATTGAIPLPVA